MKHKLHKPGLFRPKLRESQVQVNQKTAADLVDMVQGINESGVVEVKVNRQLL